MAEYIERDALLFAMDDYFHGTDPDGDEQIGVLKMMRLVRTFDAADVERGMCYMISGCPQLVGVGDNFWCAYGERKGGDG